MKRTASSFLPAARRSLYRLRTAPFPLSFDIQRHAFEELGMPGTRREIVLVELGNARTVLFNNEAREHIEPEGAPG
jgi:hypothetical protein